MTRLVLRSLAILCATTVVACTTTPRNDYEFNANDWILNPATGHYYRITSHMTWPLARDVAASMGGYLVTINDESESAWLLENFQPTGGTWIGLNDLRIEGRWEWDSGESVAYSNWRAGQPNNTADTAHCVAIDSMKTEIPGKWSDYEPSEARRAIVERNSSRRR